MFKRIIETVLLAIFMLFTSHVTQVSAFGDEEKTIYLQIDYLNVTGADAAGFNEMKNNLWKPIHKERVNRGDIISWSLYDALITGPDAYYDYNYVMITETDDFSTLYSAFSKDAMASVHPDKSEGELNQQLRSGYEVVNSEIWRVNGAALPEGADGPRGEYITKNYMDFRGGSGEYASMELDFWKPIHYVRIDQDILNSWVMYTMVKPGGGSRNYTYSTIDYYDDLADIEGSVGMELARIAHPDLTDEELSDFFTRTGASRTAYKTELWRLVQTTHTEKK